MQDYKQEYFKKKTQCIMNLTKLIVADISVCLKDRVTCLVGQRDTVYIIISLGWHGHADAASPLVYSKLFDSEVAQTVAVWRWCWIMFQKKKKYFENQRGSGSSSSAEVRAVRHEQGSDPYLGAMWALPAVPWKWSEWIVHLLMDVGGKMEEVSSPDCF